MSKRFTDTEKWRRPWFRTLPNEYKLLWIYILDNCDITGLWYVDFELASFSIGTQVIEETALTHLSKQVEVLGPGRWFVKDFTSFQYGELRDTNNFHASLKKKLENLGVFTPLTRGVSGDKDKDKVKDKVKEKGGLGENNPMFLEFWKAYPKHEARKKAFQAFENLNPDQELLKTMILAIEIRKKTDQWKKNNGEYIPMPATWINQKRWEDEIKKPGAMIEIPEWMQTK